MNLGLTDTQLQLGSTVARLLREKFGFSTRQSSLRAGEPWNSELWSAFAELGLLGMCVPSSAGGVEANTSDLFPVMQELGRALVIEPFLSSAILGTSALACASEDGDVDAVLGALTTGRQTVTYVDNTDVATEVRASRSGTTWVLSGAYHLVLHGAQADYVVTSARIDSGPHGAGLFLVDSRESGLRRRRFRLIDQTSAAELSFDRCAARLLMPPASKTTATLRKLEALGIAAICAEATGAMRAASEQTADYLQTRTQFGQPLSRFQSLRHRMAEITVAVETAEAMAILAAVSVDSYDNASMFREVAQAKLVVGSCARWVGEQAVQLHGGIGMTDEYVIGHYLQRLVVLDTLMADRDTLLDRLIAAEH